MTSQQKIPTELFKQAFLQANESMFLLDPAGIIIALNQAAYQLLGYDSDQDLLGTSLKSLIQAPLAKDLLAVVPAASTEKQGMASLMPDYVQGIHHKGEPLLLDLKLSPIQLGGHMWTLVHAVDVSTQIQLTKSLFEGEALLRSIIANAVDGIITIDERGTIETVNPAAAHLFGYEPEEVIGHNVSILMPEPHRSSHDQYIDNYHRTGEAQIIGIGREVEGLRKDGTYFPFWLSISKVSLSDREIFTGLIHDISQIKRVERKLRLHAEELERSNRELQDFAYVSSHDLQEPLRKIQAFGSRIMDREGLRLSPQGKDFLGRMLNASERMQNLIDDLLRYSRVSTQGNDFQPVDIAGEVAGVLMDLEVLVEQTQAKIEIDPLPIIEADPVQMRQLFQNLLSNALKFRQADQAPVIQVICRSVNLRNGSLVPGVEIQIVDNGIGFDERYQQKIFVIFQRLEGQKFQGSGIGLAVCKRIVQRHHGEIEASSPGVDQGATFTVRLPLQQS